MPTIVEGASANAELFAAALGKSSKVVANLEELKRQLQQDPDEYAIVIGPGVDLEAAAALADNLRVTRPATSVILVRRRVDTSVLSEALRSGMREVVEERDLTGLTAAVGRASEVWEALHGPIDRSAGHGKIITVFSPKGGVGKTTTAVNLAVALSDHDTKRVCIVDLDLGFGDVAITLHLFPARTIADAAPLEAGLDLGALETLLTPHGDNLFALVAPVQPDAKDTITPALVGKILRLLKTSFEYVVVDSAPSFDEFILQAIDETDELLLLTTLDVPTLKNVKIAIETLDLLNFRRESRRLILNRADEKVGLTQAKVEETLGMKVTHAIPTSSQVANATNSGEPIVTALPKHAVSQAIMALATTLSEVPAPVDPTHSSGSRSANGARRGLLRRK